jgi:lysozyme
MGRLVRGGALCLALLASLALGGCSYRHTMTRYASSSAVSAALQAAGAVPASAVMAPRAQAIPPRFSDAHPVVWPGRTPGHYPVHGIDLSRWQEEVDWPTARAHGVNFAFIKATEGGDHADPGFARHWRDSAAAGVPRGAYHFYYFCRSAAEQAAWYIANVPKERGMLPPVLDVEWNGHSRTCTYRPDPAKVRAEMTTFLNIVGRHYGLRPIVYTTVDFYHDNELWLLDGTQPWLRAVTRHPSEAYPGEPWTFWQYSGTGLIPGIKGEVDLNAFAGSPADWSAWLARNSL